MTVRWNFERVEGEIGGKACDEVYLSPGSEDNIAFPKLAFLVENVISFKIMEKLWW